MMRKGYVEQQLEGLIVFLARLLGLQKRDNPEEVLAALRDGAKSLAGMDLDHLIRLPEPVFLTLFQAGMTSTPSLDAGKAAIIGTLMMEEAEERERTGNDDGLNTLRFSRAHLLLGAALAQEPFLRTQEMMVRLLALKRRMRPEQSGRTPV